MNIKCIYCLEEKSKNHFKKREHVIPQSFGKFKNNYVLHKIVCDDCNQYFGDNLEYDLAKDTIEGIMRYQHGIEPKVEKKKRKRIKLKILNGEYKGVVVTPIYFPNNGETTFKIVLQIGFYSKEKCEYIYFEPEDIPLMKNLKSSIDFNKPLNYYFDTEKEFNYLQDILKNNGIRVAIDNKKNMMNKENRIIKDLFVHGFITIDSGIYRAFSKIAFNYLTYIMGKDFVFSKEFNKIREFIRYEIGNPNNFFTSNIPPILEKDKKLKECNLPLQTNGHLLTLEWWGSKLVSKVSLFNFNTYLITFCNNYQGIYIPIKYAHLFDIKTKDISKVNIVKK